MTIDTKVEERFITGMGVMIAAPVLIIIGSLAILMLATPVLVAVGVIAFGMTVLFLGRALTRETPMIERSVEEVPMCESVDLFPMMVSEGLSADAVEMVETLADGPKTVVTASITKVYGACPLGLMPGNSWNVGPEGGLSRPMCRAGATALNALFRMSEGNALDRSACCDCPFGGREVTFTVREAEEDLMGVPV